MMPSPHILRGKSKRWRLAAPHPLSARLAAELRTSPLMGHLLAQRGARNTAEAQRFMDPALRDLLDPALLNDCTKAAERLCRALKNNEPIAIYGDYDVDGVAASAILYHTLRTAKPDARVLCYVPHRLDEGYGLNSEAIATLVTDGWKTIVSVDCGITAIEPAALAHQLGADLIITDHHEHGPQLPQAFARVHPLLAPEGGEPYPFPHLCGAGVAYKLAWQIARCWCGSDRVPEIFRNLLIDLLPLTALATVADIVPLTGENRAIVIHGLKHCKHTPWEGLNALIAASNLSEEKIDSYQVGFVLGPRLNACGRMGHAGEAVRLLTEARGEEADRIARFLNKENEVRRRTGLAIFEQARQQVCDLGYDRDDVRAIVLAGDDWHPGVVGIVCSRLVEAFGRPTVLLGGNNDMLKGSARSIEGFNMHEAFTACSKWFENYGGHAMAAGGTLKRENFENFRSDFLAYAAERLQPDDLIPALDLEAEAPIAELDVPALRHIQKLGPFGRSNPAPLFMVSNVEIAQPPQTMGQGGKHLSLLVRQGRTMIRCVAWGEGDCAAELSMGDRLDLAAEAKINSFRGAEKPELEIKDFRVANN